MTRPATFLCNALAAALLAASLLAAGAEAGHVGTTPLLAGMPPPAEFAPPADRVALGRLVFFDARLSEPRGTSCASCHDPARGFAGNNGSRLGVALGSRPGSHGVRNTPSVLYVRYVPRLFFYQDDDAPAPAPFGGLFADGRVDALEDLARNPLLNPLEMGNRSEAEIATKLRATPYAAAFRDVFGRHALDGDAGAVAALGKAIAAYLQSDEMAPFSSRYDRYVRGQGTLSPQELRGLRLFKDPDKGNCIACHKFNDTSNNPARSLFTDYGFDAIGVPRNQSIPANAAGTHFDHGLCEVGAKRGWPDAVQWCGYFRTPSLRNVALRERLMHNGAFHDLREAVSFYASRSIDPERWYGKHGEFDDVAQRYRTNINIATMPYNRRRGMRPALDEQDIDEIVAFLRTLTDAQFLGTEGKASASRDK